MATRNQILNDVSSFSVEDLYEAILDGEITYPELCELPDFSHKRRRQLSDLFNGSEDEDWDNAKTKNTIDGYQAYIAKYSNGKYLNDANQAIDIIERREKERKEWEALPGWDIDAVRKYIQKHPNSSYMQEAQQIIDEQGRQEDEEIWNKVKKDDFDDLSDFIKKNPKNRYINEAKNLLDNFLPIDDLLEEIRNIEKNTSLVDPIKEITAAISKYIDKGERNIELFIREIKKNKNLLSEGVIRNLLNIYPKLNVYLREAVGDDFMKAFNNRYVQQITLPTVDTPEKITRTSTEFYFWGIPASGKTCLMASLLSAADNGHAEDVHGMIPNASCSGYEYLTYLMGFFSGEGNILRLMPGNGKGSVAEMGFDLIDSKGKSHPITFIDMPGGVFKAMHKELCHDVNNPFKEDLSVVDRLLVDRTSNSNQKVHIFVVEYGAHNKKDGDGCSQQIYLQSAAAYIKEKNIFEKKTDMICIIFTKADLAENGPEKFDWKAYLKKYYNGFYTTLKAICKKNEINNGEPVKFWFSIGDVCFRSYCKYNKDAAHKVLNFIVNRTWKQPNKFSSLFSK